MSAVTVRSLRAMKARGERIAALTAYDYSFACLLEAAGLDILMVGDSLGMVVQGHDATLPVTLDQMVYHSACVARARRRALQVVDLPFGVYQAGPAEAWRAAARLMAEGGAQVVKLEGGAVMADTVRFLTARGIPVCAHLGLTPQSVHQLGGYRVQGRDAQEAERLLEDARALEDAGASLLVLEAVPSVLAAEVTAALDIPTLGIGAGPHCDGQVLVLYDMLGLYPGHTPKFCRNFMADHASVPDALRAYVQAVRDGSFPAAEHSYDAPA